MKTKGLLGVVVLIMLVLGPFLPQVALAGNWTFTGSLNTARMYHTVTRLADGKVLVAGGTSDGFNLLQSCEIYNPATGQWTTTGNLINGRISHKAVLLPNGKVLVAGGSTVSGLTNTAELFDPAANSGVGVWTTTSPLTVARIYHSCTLLANGMVLVAGGGGGGGAFNSCELYDVGTAAWATTGAGTLTTARRNHTATLLRDGTVLVEGGLNSSGAPLKNAEIYDAFAGSWTATGSPSTAHGDEHTAFLMPDSTVLVAGGFNESFQVTGVTEYYDIEGDWPSDPLASLNVGRAYHAAALLANGKVLVAGGWGGGLMTNNLTSAELYNPIDNTWSFTDSLNTARRDIQAVLLANGTVLVVGGNNGSGVPLQTAEIYSPHYVWNPAGPPAYFAGTGHWYRAFTFSDAELWFCYNNWEFARVKAEAMGGYLATVTSEAENNFILNLIKQDKLWLQPRLDDSDVYGPWLGGYQDYRLEATLAHGWDDESTYYLWKSNGDQVYADQAWKWVTGEPWSYAPWAYLEPNDYPYYEGLPAYERGHQNYLYYHNKDYDPSNPASTKWAPYWDDHTLDGWNYVQGFVVEWDQKPRLPGVIAPLNMLLLD